MGLLNKIFGSKKHDIEVVDIQSFWGWFACNADSFYKVLKSEKNIERDFLDKLLPKLHAVNNQFFCLVGMYNDTIAELVITPEGDIKTFVFVEELIEAAPQLKNWKFTAFKQELDIENVSINMADYQFSKETLSYCSTINPQCPDEINITLVHRDYNEDDKNILINGSYIFIDNYLGELNACTLIDSLLVKPKSEVSGELISIDKLKSYILYREKEFVEKYEGLRYDTENDKYSGLEFTDDDDMKGFAVVNSELLSWEAKASHSWMFVVEIKYAGNDVGLPESDVYDLMDKFEEELLAYLVDFDGYLNLGRETFRGLRTVYWACKDFRKPAKVGELMVDKYIDQLDITTEIYKDKYWLTMNKFQPSID